MSRLRPLPSLFIAASLAFAPACTQKKDTTAPAAADTIVAGSASHGDNAINERLERLTERLEKARVEAHVPGMAIAVVKDDVVIFARGFGLADLQSKRPATKDTTFAIGSSTKAFTSALVGTFVDEGKIGWDDEITKHIPEMKLKVRATDRKPTLRDAMSHRTGFTRMGVLWAGGGVTREEMFRTTSSAEPLADYGKTFLYNNVVYASAGEAAARVGGKSWSELISERLLVPLSMSASNTSAKIAKDDPKRAQGYRFDDATGEFEAVPMRDLDLIGPAGSINSSVVDMSQWVRLQLGRGEIDGKRVISKERIEDTWSPQIKVAGSMQYGLGWFVQDWRGHRVIEHGGNIDGYAAAVALLPDDGLGFVLLTNVSATPLQASVRSIVWESMLEPLNPQSAQGSALDPTPFEGKYVADFGPFEDQRFVVSAKDGKLFLDVPGQTNYELLPPDGDDKRRFAVTDQVAASFELGDNGQANLLRLHQGGMDMEMPREGWTAPAEIDLAAHAGHLGSYTSEDGAKTVTVVVRGNRLAVDVPGQMAYELHKPDKDGKWRFRVKKDELAVSFETGKAKKGKSAVVALVMHQGTKDNIRMIRKTGGAKLPTAAELAKLRKAPKREKAIARLGLVEATGTIRLAHSGVQGKITIVFDATRSSTVLDLGAFGRIVEVDNGKRAWSAGTLGPVRELHGKYLAQAHQAHPLAMLRALGQAFDEVQLASEIRVDGNARMPVTLRNGELPSLAALVDPKTGDIVQVKANRLVPMMGGRIQTTTKLSDYREVLGLRMPFHLETEDRPSGRTIVTLDSVKPFTGDASKVFPAAPPKT